MNPMETAQELCWSSLYVFYSTLDHGDRFGAGLVQGLIKGNKNRVPFFTIPNMSSRLKSLPV